MIGMTVPEAEQPQPARVGQLLHGQVVQRLHLEARARLAALGVG